MRVHRVMRLYRISYRFVGLEWRATGQQVIERAAQAVNVGPDVGLLRRRGSAPGPCSRACPASGRHGSGRRRPAPSLCRPWPSPKSSTLIIARLPWLREHQIARLDVAMDHALLVGVLQPEGGLDARNSKRCDTGSGPLALTSLDRSSPSTYSIAKTMLVAKPDGRVGRHDIGVVQPCDRAHLNHEAIEHARPLHHVPAHDLQHFVPRPISRFLAR